MRRARSAQVKAEQRGPPNEALKLTAARRFGIRAKTRLPRRAAAASS